MLKNMDLRVLMDIYIFSIPEYEKVVFGMPSVCVTLYVCMYASYA
jgi:hypothetical protein